MNLYIKKLQTVDMDGFRIYEYIPYHEAFGMYNDWIDNIIERHPDRLSDWYKSFEQWSETEV